jgi:hypothetical protein
MLGLGRAAGEDGAKNGCENYAAQKRAPVTYHASRD